MADKSDPTDILKQNLSFSDIRLTPLHRSSVLGINPNEAVHNILFNYRKERFVMSDERAEEKMRHALKNSRSYMLTDEDFLEDRKISSGLSHRAFVGLIEKQFAYFMKPEVSAMAVSEIHLANGKVWEGVLAVDVKRDIWDKLRTFDAPQNRFHLHKCDSIKDRDSYLETHRILRTLGNPDKQIQPSLLNS